MVRYRRYRRLDVLEVQPTDWVTKKLSLLIGFYSIDILES